VKELSFFFFSVWLLWVADCCEKYVKEKSRNSDAWLKKLARSRV
jgi:hypothetical protein